MREVFCFVAANRKEKADRDFRRVSKLYEKGTVSIEVKQNGETALRLSEARLDKAKEKLRLMSLKSPIAGVLSRSRVEVGETVQAGQPLFDVIDVEEVILEMGVPEYRITEIRPGQEARITLEACPGKEYRGAVTRVGDEADPRSLLFPVEITLKNPRRELRPGMLAKARIYLERERQVYVLPMSSTYLKGGKRTVYVEKGGIAREVELSRTFLFNSDLIVLSDEIRGARVIVEGHSDLRDGVRVKVFGEKSPLNGKARAGGAGRTNARETERSPAAVSAPKTPCPTEKP